MFLCPCLLKCWSKERQATLGWRGQMVPPCQASPLPGSAHGWWARRMWPGDHPIIPNMGWDTSADPSQCQQWLLSLVSISESGSGASFVCHAQTPEQNRNAGSLVPPCFWVKAGLFWDAWSMIVAKIDTSNTERFLCAVTAKRQLRRRSRGIHLSLKSVAPVTFRFGTKRHTSNKKHDFFIHWISSFGLNFSVITLLPMVYFPLATTCYNRGLVGTS